MNSQTLILDRLTARLDAIDGVIHVRDQQWANTGIIRTLDADTLEPIQAVSYDFQDNRASFKVVDAAANYVAHYDYNHPGRGSAPFVCPTIPDLVARVADYLKGTTS